MKWVAVVHCVPIKTSTFFLAFIIEYFFPKSANFYNFWWTNMADTITNSWNFTWHVVEQLAIKNASNFWGKQWKFDQMHKICLSLGIFFSCGGHTGSCAPNIIQITWFLTKVIYKNQKWMFLLGKKGSPYSITEHRVPELIPVLGSQQFCCLVNRGTMGVNSLPKTVTRQHRNCNLNPGPSAPESSKLNTRLPSHPFIGKQCIQKPQKRQTIRKIWCKPTRGRGNMHVYPRHHKVSCHQWPRGTSNPLN